MLYTIDHLHSIARHHLTGAKATLEKTLALGPTILLLKDNVPVALSYRGDWNDEDFRLQVYAAVRAHSKEMDADAYVFVSDTNRVNVTGDECPEALLVFVETPSDLLLYDQPYKRTGTDIVPMKGTGIVFGEQRISENEGANGCSMVWHYSPPQWG